MQQLLPFTVLKRSANASAVQTGLKLQQLLPFTVLKLWGMDINPNDIKLQQLLPFTVLKPLQRIYEESPLFVATALTVYGIETLT